MYHESGSSNASNYLDDIFNQLMPELEQEDTYFQRYPHQLCICHDIPWICRSTVMTYHPLQDGIPQDNKPCLILLSTFEATYHGNLTPLAWTWSLVIDTGASVAVMPFKTDFIGLITPFNR